MTNGDKDLYGRFRGMTEDTAGSRLESEEA
jgi:hypothetical protein